MEVIEAPGAVGSTQHPIEEWNRVHDLGRNAVCQPHRLAPWSLLCIGFTRRYRVTSIYDEQGALHPTYPLEVNAYESVILAKLARNKGSDSDRDEADDRHSKIEQEGLHQYAPGVHIGLVETEEY